MNLTSMLLSLRRRLKDNPKLPGGSDDIAGREWGNDILLEFLNAGYQQVQKEILKVDSEPWIKIKTVDVTAAEARYPRPTDCWWETELALKDSSATSGYRPLRRFDHDLLETVDAATEPGYDRQGQYYLIAPTPSTSVTDGIRLTYVHILSLNEQSEPIIPVPLHMAIVVWAHLLLVGENDEASDKIRQTLQDIMGDISIYYYRHGAEPDTVIVDVDNMNGQRSARGVSGTRSRWSRR